MKKILKIMMLSLAVALLLCGCFRSENDHPLVRKARQSVRTGEYKNAEACYLKYLEQKNDSPVIHRELAQLYDEHLRDYIRAIYHYKEYLRLTPDKEGADAVNVSNFIKRCEERYFVKPEEKKNTPDVDELEIAALTEAYRKQQAIEQKKLEDELNALKKQKSEVRPPADIQREEVIIPELENKTNKKQTPALTVDPELAASNMPDRPDIPAESRLPEVRKNEEKKNISVAPQEKASTEKNAEKNNSGETIRDFSKLPEMKNIPSEQKSTDTSENTVVHKIVRGDTFSHLSRKYYGSTRYYKKLMEYNNITNPNGLRIGKTVKIPPLAELLGEKK